MDTLQMILVTIVTLGVLVTVHEYGHFWVARRLGVKVLRFSIGFGSPLLQWKDKDGVEYQIAAIPLGGYVKMLDEREADVPESEQHRAFNRQTPAVRIAIAAAGPAANFLLAIAAWWLVFANGVQGVAPVVGSVQADSIAQQAGIEVGDEIVSVDGRETPTWNALRMQLLDRVGETGQINIQVREDAIEQASTNTTRDLSAQINGWLIGHEEPDVIGGLGIELYRPSLEPVLDQVMADGAAYEAGFESGDRIVEVNAEAIDSWQAWVEQVQASPGQPMDVLVERSGRDELLVLVPDAREVSGGVKQGYAGVSVVIPEWPEHLKREFEYSLIGAAGAAVNKTWEMTRFTLDALGKMITGLLSPKNLSGPITIAKVAGASAQYGLFAWLGLLALLSVSLAVLNLLPIPVLDGGHIVYASLEWIMGKPVSERVQMMANQLGLVLVLSLMAFAVYNDVLRL